MSEFLAYAQLGFHHVASLGALDHLLFLAALAAVYRLRDWRSALWVVTAFTLGHSLTLALVVTRVVELPTAWIEFLIPVTIVLTAATNLLARRVDGPGRTRAIAAASFGLIHGAGFAEYLRAMFLEQIAVPLVGFNLGIEAAQIMVLSLLAIGLSGLDRALATGIRGDRWRGFERRVVAVSLLAGFVATGMAYTRLPR